MEYITVAEAAKKWGVTLRQVQRLVAADRIRGAKKHGQAYMIPTDAEKPGDTRRKKGPPPPRGPSDGETTRSPSLVPRVAPAYLPATPEFTLPAELDEVIAATVPLLPLDDPDAVLDTVSEDRFRWAIESYLAYLRGDFKRAIQRFRKIDSDALKLRACGLGIAMAISTGDYPLYQEIESYCKGMISANLGANVTAVAEYAVSVAYVNAFAPAMIPNWLKNGDYSALPHRIKPDALCLRMSYLHFLKKYETVLEIAQTALAFDEPKHGISYMDICLRLRCAVACCWLDRLDDASGHLLDAMKDCLPHGFITPFAENATLLGGLLERLLEREYPEHYEAVIGLSKRIITNWIDFHNRFTKDNITLILSLREIQIAQLAAFRVPYAKIAEQFSISTGRVNNIMREIYAKLSVSNREELSKIIIYSSIK